MEEEGDREKDHLLLTEVVDLPSLRSYYQKKKERVSGLERVELLIDTILLPS